jgi:hypothetical protein
VLSKCPGLFAFACGNCPAALGTVVLTVLIHYVKFVRFGSGYAG